MARRSDHSREEIHRMALDAARSIIESEGLSGISARKVASHMGYTVGTLYLVFRNLDDLIVQANIQTLADVYSHLEQAVSGCKQPEHCIHALGQAYIDYAMHNSQRWGALYEHTLGAEAELPAPFHEQVGQIFTLVENVLQPLAPQRPAEEISQAARAIWSGVHGICVLSLTHKLHLAGIESVQSLTDNLISNFMAGFRLQQ